jgi:hypothetical protein
VKKLIAVLMLWLIPSVCHAWVMAGHVECATGQRVAGVTVLVTSTDPAHPFDDRTVTDATGNYQVVLPEVPGPATICYHATLALTPDQIISPPGGICEFYGFPPPAISLCVFRIVPCVVSLAPPSAPRDGPPWGRGKSRGPWKKKHPGR